MLPFLRRLKVYIILLLILWVTQQLLSFSALSTVQAENKATLATNTPATSTVTLSKSDCLPNKGFALTNPDKVALDQLEKATNNQVEIYCHSKTGKVRFIGSDQTQPLPMPATGLAPGANNPENAARTFLQSYGTLFGLKDQATELTVMKQSLSNQGRTFTRFQQNYKNIPVMGGELIAQITQNQQVLSVGGEVLPDLQLDLTPKIDLVKAQESALALVSKHYNVPITGLKVTEPKLWIFDEKLMGGPIIQPSALVWRMEVTLGANSSTTGGLIQELVLVDAHSGEIVVNFNQVNSAKWRYICDNYNISAYAANCVSYVRGEGGSPTSVNEVNRAYDYLGNTYDFYYNNFGRDSIDGAGLPLKATVRYCEPGYSCPYQNAFFDSTLNQTYFGSGFVDLEIIGHELTHAVTNATSNLFYYYQSGAINESLSDIFGESIQFYANPSSPRDWLVGENLSIGPFRSMKNPPLYNDPDRTGSYYYYGGEGDNGGVHYNSGVGNKAAYLIAEGSGAESGGMFNGHTINGLGYLKAAHIFYETNTYWLTSAADYTDLYLYLQMGCYNLVGYYGISYNDCLQVGEAVTATEMNITPANAQVPEAPLCTGGLEPLYYFMDDFENPYSGRWLYNYPWTATTGYATSGIYSLWAPDINTVGDYSIQTASNIWIPPGAYLRFNHAYTFEHGTTTNTNYDGGVVELSNNGGFSWFDAGGLFVNNGYNISALYSSTGNPLGGRAAFGGVSKGYYSSRLSLSSLANQYVQIRFRVGTDSSVSSRGWFIDDMNLYTCIKPATTTSLTTSINPSSAGYNVTFSSRVNPYNSSAYTPSGFVYFYDGTTLLGSGNLSGGLATFSTSSLTIGSHNITAVYSGDSLFQGSTSTILTQVCVKALTTNQLTSSANPSAVGYSITFKARLISQTSSVYLPSGTVYFYDGTTLLGSGNLSGGLATFSTSSLTIGSHNITAVYNGDSLFQGSTSTILAQAIVQACTSGVVTSQTDTGSGGSCGTLSLAIVYANSQPPTGNKTVTFASTLNRITLYNDLSHPASGVTINGGCNNGPGITLDGNGVITHGLYLGGGVTIKGLAFTRFTNQGLIATTTGGAKNILNCVKLSR
ncbi:MAG: M4 family metallopeptidase [Chloroflexota bacterium]